MKKEIKIPAMGESVTEATIGRFLKPSGSDVQENEEIVELETEKVNQVLYAPTSGQIQWSVSEGDSVKIGDVIGFVEEGAVKKEKKPEKKEVPPAPAKPQQAPKAAPTAPRQTEEASGRIREKEFIAELKKPPAPKAVEKPIPKEEVRPPTKSDGRESRKKISRIRKVIASRLVEVLHSTAMLTTFNEVDMSAIIELRTRYKDSFQKAHGVKLGFMSFFVKAVVEGLKAIPDVNSYIDGEEIVERHYYDIGIAVGTDRGLVVPVVRGCEHLSFAEIEREIEEYAKKAREGRLTIEDMQGGGFTITNGGVYGSLLSTPILNPPQSGILGMHKIEKRPVVVEDQIVIRPMMYLAMSYDHRVIDGKQAVTFLVRVKEVLEDPERLLFFDAQV